MAKCKARAKSGKRCAAKAAANGYCSIHQYPEKAAELSLKAAEARRKAAAEAHARAEILAPKTPDELLGQLAEVFAELKNGKLDVAVARTMANVGMVILKGFEVVDLKKQLQAIQGLLNRRT
jgi:O-succinylbenzoate synthase